MKKTWFGDAKEMELVFLSDSYDIGFKVCCELLEDFGYDPETSLGEPFLDLNSGMVYEVDPMEPCYVLPQGKQMAAEFKRLASECNENLD